MLWKFCSMAWLKNSRKSDYIFVDEYQDSNLVRKPFSVIFQRDNMFMVGDVKQSIYHSFSESIYFMKIWNLQNKQAQKTIGLI